MATSEIEKLERRYAENPHGLTFAPLAEVHRKNGDVPRALELLTAGLELHPNYIPASIVLGRCHQDLGDFTAAEAAFAHVLRLDDENVIALKSLADINERLERYDDAESWLRRLVTVDRSNEEAHEQLRRLETVKNGGQQGAAPTGTPVAQTAPPAAEEKPKRPSAEVAALDLPPVDLGALDVSEKTSDPVPVKDVAPPQPALAPPPSLEQPPPLSGLDVLHVPSITDAPPPSDPGSVEPMPGLISQEFQAPRSPAEIPVEPLDIALETSQDVVLEGSGGSEYSVPNAAEDFREFVARAEAQADRPVKEPAPPREVPAPAPTLEIVQAEPPKSEPSNSAREPKGQSVAAFFRAMLAARPPSNSEPGRPTQDGLSLSSVIGEERKAPPSAAAAESKSDPHVSFDDFFGSKPDGEPAEKSAEPGKDDLDQFRSWLQNLKR